MDEQMKEGAPSPVRGECEDGLDEQSAKLAEWIARAVSERVIEAIQSGGYAGGPRILPYSRVETCNITGLRRRQFERFCEIMRENPTEAPFRAAKTVLAELGGRGGYSRPSSLQRYAGKHRRYW